MRNLLAVTAVVYSLVLSACSSIALNEVDPDDLTVDVRFVQDANKTQLDVMMARGIWHQPVTQGNAALVAYSEDGRDWPLAAANKKGRYGFVANDAIFLTQLQLGSFSAVEFPLMNPVHIAGKDSFTGQLFFRDDVLNLALPPSHGSQRFLVATGQCGANQYESKLDISTDQHTLEIRLDSVMHRINAVAESDLNGIIPLTLAIEEHYPSRWPEPFNRVELIARDSSKIQLDTSGFRFKADIRVQLGANLFVRLQNQPWPTRYCF